MVLRLGSETVAYKMPLELRWTILVPKVFVDDEEALRLVDLEIFFIISG